jgi:hypothetical protein
MANNGQEHVQEKVEVRAVSMYPEDWAEVEVLARTQRLSISGALRKIVQEWRDLREPTSVAKEHADTGK